MRRGLNGSITPAALQCLRRLYCRIFGHWYLPMHHVSSYYAGSTFVRKGIQYHCHLCGKPTKVMRLKHVKAFEKLHAPAWASGTRLQYFLKSEREWGD